VELLQVVNARDFHEAPEAAMDMHIARSKEDEAGALYIVVGGRVAFPIDVMSQAIVTEYLEQAWLAPGVLYRARVELFEAWLTGLRRAPVLRRVYGEELARIVAGDWRGDMATLGYHVSPLGPLPAAPARPAAIYGHLPFGTVTAADSVIYRWEAFPGSRRVFKGGGAGYVIADTYAAPASEVPFAPTGFSALARFALPNLLPACFRWEIQPVPGFVECGASVPLYGQSGGGVEIRFPAMRKTRCEIADPVVLGAL
jgi:hypothetical protein